MNKVETILHPVRLRIIQQLLDGQATTAKQLAGQLKDIAQATLYRQLDILVKAEVLAVTEERQIRGAVEKTYELNGAAAVLTNDEVMELTKEDHLKYFMFFAVHLTKSFEEYLDNGPVDLERDGVGYRQLALHLDDEEFDGLLTDLRGVFAKYIKYEPTEERTKRVISTVIIPEAERGKADE